MKAKPLSAFLSAAALFVLAPLAAGAAKIEIRLSAPDRAGGNAPLGTAVVQDLDRPDQPPLELEISTLGQIQVETPGGKRWLLKLQSRDYWAADLEVESGTAPQPWILFPVVRYRIARPRTTPLPADVVASFTGLRQPGSKVPPPTGRARCDGDPQLKSCAVPSVPLDLKIEPAGFAPVFFWNLSGDAGSAQDLGSIQLLAGASIAGRIVDGEGEPLIADLEAYPSTIRDPGAPDLETQRRLGLKSVKAKSDERGHFQIVGIAPGEVDIKVSAPGFIPTTLIRQIELSAGEAKLLAYPLVYLRPKKLKLQLFPELDPWKEPWAVELQADPLEDVDLLRKPAERDGSWVSGPLPPGRYSLRIFDHRKQVWERRYVDLDVGDGALPVEIPVLRIRGSVRVSGEPASGTLYLQQHPSNSGLRFEIDEKGELEGFVAGEGRWLASLERSGSAASAIVPVEIAKRPGKSYAELEIDFPDTRIHGDVADADGKKVAGAVISYFSHLTKAMGSVSSDAEGKFEILGVPPGPVNLNARKDALQSPGIILTVEEGSDDPPQRLVLHEQVEIEGLVVQSGSPVAGTRIVAWPDFASTSLASVFTQTSSPEGTFRFEVPGFVSQLTVFVEARGIQRLLRHPVRSSERLIVETDVAGGELIVDLTSLVAGRGAEALVQVSLMRDGISLPHLIWSFLGITATSTPGLYRLGLFEAGNYGLCVGMAAPGSASPVCTNGYLAPNAALRLEPPRE